MQLKCPFPIIDCGPLYHEPGSHRVIDMISDSGRRYGFLLMPQVSLEPSLVFCALLLRRCATSLRDRVLFKKCGASPSQLRHPTPPAIVGGQ
jgi:hypothetical protein